MTDQQYDWTELEHAYYLLEKAISNMSEPSDTLLKARESLDNYMQENNPNG